MIIIIALDFCFALKSSNIYIFNIIRLFFVKKLQFKNLIIIISSSI